MIFKISLDEIHEYGNLLNSDEYADTISAGETVSRTRGTPPHLIAIFSPLELPYRRWNP